ncbi:MAG: ECF transporter S component [Clostridia bacterium]|nr:ECF transporter S component [Clostridia bacterium]
MIVIQNKTARSVLRVLIPLLLMPCAVMLGIFVFDEKAHAFISVLVAMLSVILFLCGFDRKKTGTRRLILISVMIALSVVGRFFPLFKPVTAFAVIAGMYFGAEAGFLTGSFSALISNFYFGQGPWTPFQMFAWGILGFAAGLMGKPLKKNRVMLYGYAFLSGILYSLVMDIWTVLWELGGFSAEVYLAKMLTALPHTLLYAVSNVIFLYLFAKPFGEKLERVKLKYGV